MNRRYPSVLPVATVTTCSRYFMAPSANTATRTAVISAVVHACALAQRVNRLLQLPGPLLPSPLARQQCSSAKAPSRTATTAPMRTANGLCISRRSADTHVAEDNVKWRRFRGESALSAGRKLPNMATKPRPCNRLDRPTQPSCASAWDDFRQPKAVHSVR